MNELKHIWDTNLVATQGGIVVSIGDVILVLSLLLFGYILSRSIEYLLAKKLRDTDLNADAISVIKRVSFYLIFILVGLTILSLLGIPITAFAFATGAIAIGVGFGAQNIINNFISGWILIAERPIRTDDFVEIEGVMGVVKTVGTRSTLIHRTDGVHMLVPNSKLLENTLVNWTLVDDLIRSSIRVGVAYGSDTYMTMELLSKCVDEHTDVLKEPKQEIIFDDFGDNALIFEIFFWCRIGREKTLRMIRSDIRFAIHNAFAENGIILAFPQRDLHLHTKKPIEITLNRES